MKYQIEDQTLTIQLNGKIIMSNSDRTKNDLKNIISEAVKENNIESVEIDLKDVEFIDSTGIGVFISIYKFIVEKKLNMKLLRPQEIVEKIITITKINNIITIEK